MAGGGKGSHSKSSKQKSKKKGKTRGNDAARLSAAILHLSSWANKSRHPDQTPPRTDFHTHSSLSMYFQTLFLFVFFFGQCVVVALVPSLFASLVLDESSPGRRWLFVALRGLGFNVFNAFCNVLLLHLCLHCLPPYCWMNYPLAGDGFLSPAEVVNRAHRNGVKFPFCHCIRVWVCLLNY